MCIIVAKNAGVEMPSDETLKACWNKNPDGAGFMYAANGSVTIEKGFMSFESFRTAIKNLGRQYDLAALPLVMHFRIGTHGANDARNTHPFPITHDAAELGTSRIVTRRGALAHNGIIDLCAGHDKADPVSDTFRFVRDYASRLIEAADAIKDDWVQTVLFELAGSKLTLLHPDGTIVNLGSFIEEDGVWYSNSGYRIWQIDGNYGRPSIYPYSYAMGGVAGYGLDDYYADYLDYDEGEPDGLTRCTEGMWYYDDKADEYVECDPKYDYFDKYGQLWTSDMDGEPFTDGFQVYNHELRVVSGM